MADPFIPSTSHTQAGTLYVRVGFELRFKLPFAAPMLLVVEAQDSAQQRVASQREWVLPTEDGFSKYRDSFGNVVWRLHAQSGEITLGHDLIVEVSALPDPQYPGLPKLPIEALPNEVIQFLLPSRYVDSDLLAGEAWERFGHIQGGWAQVQAVCEHLYSACVYGVGSTSSTTAQQAYASGRAVCRDFAHMGVAFCRALNIPARYVCGYLGDIGITPDPVPMDFHAWFEAWIDGEWRTFDARHNRPRIGRVKIATGRDAADVAFATTFGATELIHMKVWADEVPADTTLADPLITHPWDVAPHVG